MKRASLLFAIVLSIFFLGNALGQQVAYSLQDGYGRHLGHVTFIYKPTGYEGMMNGEKFSLEVTSGTAVARLGNLVITTTPFEGNYYQTRVGVWRVTPVTTSFGDTGIAKMFYAGMTTSGRLYHEEMWLNGHLSSRSAMVIDHNDQIVWLVTNDQEGMLYLTRM